MVVLHWDDISLRRGDYIWKVDEAGGIYGYPGDKTNGQGPVVWRDLRGSEGGGAQAGRRKTLEFQEEQFRALVSPISVPTPAPESALPESPPEPPSASATPAGSG